APPSGGPPSVHSRQQSRRPREGFALTPRPAPGLHPRSACHGVPSSALLLARVPLSSLLTEQHGGGPGAVLWRQPEQCGGKCCEWVGLLGFTIAGATGGATGRRARRIFFI